MSSSTPSRGQRAMQKPKEDGFESDSSTGSLKQRSFSDNECKLLKQNQRLLLELERVIGDLHAAKTENSILMKSAESGKNVPDLEDNIEGLKAESKAQDKALREAEKHIDGAAKRNADLQKRLEQCMSDNADLRAEMETYRETKKAIENKRDEALQNLNEVQESWEDYQRKSKEKIRKMEQTEDEIRDMLTAVTHERDSLLDQLTGTQTSLASQEAQIHRLLNDVELEDARKHQVQQENLELQHQLDQLTVQLSDCEKQVQNAEVVRREKMRLEMEISKHMVMEQDVANLLMLIQHRKNNEIQDDSGNFSIPTSKKGNAKSAHLESKALDADLNINNNGLDDESNCNNNGLGCEGSSNIGELRTLFCNMDAEIQRLRTDLKQRDADERTYENLREELKILMDKVENGMRRTHELECHVLSLEEDKSSLCSKLEETMRSLEDRERQVQCLETRLSERNRQVVALQEDLNEKTQAMCALEKEIRELRKNVSEGSGDSNRLLRENEMLQERVRDLEQTLTQKEATLAELHEKVAELQKEMRCIQQKCEKKIGCLLEQAHEYERQTEFLKEECESIRQKHSCCSKAQDELRRTLRCREDTIKELESQIENLLYSCEEKEKLHCKLVETYQEKLNKCAEQIQQLECALMMCRNEVSHHLQTMEEIKNHFECELAQRDACIKQLKAELRKTTEDLKCKTDEVCNLERTVVALKSRLEQLCHQLKESESRNCCLTEKTKQLENQMLQEKACCMKESEELERKLSQACNNLTCANAEISKLKQALQEKSSLLDCLSTEKNSLSRDLHKCKDTANCLQNRLDKMEKDNSELCRQMQQKMDCIKDLEDALCSRDLELKSCTKCLEDLNAKIKMLHEAKRNDGMQELQNKLKNCAEEVLNKNRMLLDCEEALKSCRSELEDKCEEIKCLNCKLEELSCKLQDRIIRVEELEKAIENLHKEMEKRMKRVDEQLKRYEAELSEKCKQITDLDECLNLCQHNLNEKTMELYQQEQKSQRLCCELEAKNCKVKELEEQRDCYLKQLTESKAENAEVTQELRITREQLQTQHQELLDTQQSLGASCREVEKLRRDIDDLNYTIQQRECDIKQLTEERNCLMSKVAQLQCRLESETCQYQQQLTELKCRMEKENEGLRQTMNQLEERNSCLSQKLSNSQRQLAQVEKCCHQKLDGLSREVEDLNCRLNDREDQIVACTDAINMKEGEIMRLKLRLCSCDQTCNNSNYPDLDPNAVRADNLGNPELNPPRHSKPFHHATNSGHEDDSSRLQAEPVKSDGEEDITSGSQKDGQHQLLSEDPFDIQKQSSGDSNSVSPRNSIGVSEVQERLRSNQLWQKEIERQLKSLEENTEKDIYQIQNY